MGQKRGTHTHTHKHVPILQESKALFASSRHGHGRSFGISENCHGRSVGLCLIHTDILGGGGKGKQREFYAGDGGY